MALYYGGKVLGIDVNQHTGHHAAALRIKNQWYLIDNSGTQQKLIYKPENDIIKKEQVD